MVNGGAGSGAVGTAAFSVRVWVCDVSGKIFRGDMSPRSIVLGFGISGYAAARLLAAEGGDVTLVDRSSCEGKHEWRQELEERGVEVVCDAVELPEGNFETAVISPGIRADHPWVATLRMQGADVMSALECGWRRCKVPILAVTGTNGKSTVVKFCADVLRAAGYRAFEGGNYGMPLAALVLDEPEADWYVLEISSFQLEIPGSLKPRIGMLLNVQPDHLDRHGDMATYMDVKMSLFAGMGVGDSGVAPANQVDTLRERFGSQVSWRPFGSGGDGRFAAGCVNVSGKQIVCRGTLFDNPIMGEHLAAAAVALECAGVSAQCVEVTAKAFSPLPHRMNRLGARNGIMFIDDSKSTTLSSIGAALQMCSGPIRLIAGGLLKEKNPEMIKELLAKSVTKGYLIGTDAVRLASSWQACIECDTCETLAVAVSRAWRESREGDTILLSPGCASFDQFENFEDRGRQFVGCVERIKRGEVS